MTRDTKLEALERLDSAFRHLLATSPPPGLNEQILRQHRGRRWRWIGVAVAIAAALLLFVAWPSPDPISSVQLYEGRQLVEGTLDIDAGGVRVALKGRAAISVVRPGTVDIAIHQGHAEVWPTQSSSPILLHPGQTWSIGPRAAPRVPPSPQTANPLATLQQRNADLEVQNQVLQALVDSLRDAYEGTPLPWPTDLPSALKPAQFQANVERAIEECAPDVELLGFDCSEPPCLAKLRPPSGMLSSIGADGGWWNRLVNQCPHWVQHYTNAVTSASSSAPCPDGSEEHMHLLGWSRHLIEESHPLTNDEKENASKRFRVRIQEHRAMFQCGFP